jgi:hypothetical protein
MKTRGQKIGELIDALDNGHILYKKHGNDAFDNKEFLFKSGDYYEIRGWGTAYGTSADRLSEIVQDPDLWKIFPDFNMNTNNYPYPWSAAWEKTE